jgi:predicted amidohydrolase
MKRNIFSAAVMVSLFMLGACTGYDYFAPMEALTGSVQYDTTGSSARLNVASVAMSCDRDPDRNRQKIKGFIGEIVTEHPEVDLIVFGEMILGWYDDPDMQREYQETLAEPIPGPTTDTISLLASEYGVYITFGMVESRGDSLFNAQPVIGPDGAVVGVHHKTYLTPCDREAGFTEGKELTVVPIKGITTGIVICKDQENSRLTEEVVRDDCDLVVISYADDVVEDFFTYASDLSRKYNAWIVSANRYGQEGEYFYRGEIRVSDPGGNHHVRKEDAEQYLYYSIPFHQ